MASDGGYRKRRTPLLEAVRTLMEKLTSDLQNPRDRMLASHPESQLTVGQWLRVECQGLKELSQKKETPPQR
jgi:hypothetical protein